MTDQEFENRRARLDHTPRPERHLTHGDAFRAVVCRPGVGQRFRRWLIRPWINQ